MPGELVTAIGHWLATLVPRADTDRLAEKDKDPCRDRHRRRAPVLLSIDPISSDPFDVEDLYTTLRGRRLRGVRRIQFGRAIIMRKDFLEQSDTMIRVRIPSAFTTVPDDVIPVFPLGVAVTLHTRHNQSETLTYTYSSTFPGMNSGFFFTDITCGSPLRVRTRDAQGTLRFPSTPEQPFVTLPDKDRPEEQGGTRFDAGNRLSPTFIDVEFFGRSTTYQIRLPPPESQRGAEVDFISLPSPEDQCSLFVSFFPS